MARVWAHEHGIPDSERVRAGLRTVLEPQVTAYVTWVIEEERKRRIAFFNALNKALRDTL